jgi:hypothetical protein
METINFKSTFLKILVPSKSKRNALIFLIRLTKI